MFKLDLAKTVPIVHAACHSLKNSKGSYDWEFSQGKYGLTIENCQDQSVTINMSSTGSIEVIGVILSTGLRSPNLVTRTIAASSPSAKNKRLRLYTAHDESKSGVLYQGSDYMLPTSTSFAINLNASEEEYFMQETVQVLPSMESIQEVRDMIELTQFNVPHSTLRLTVVDEYMDQPTYDRFMKIIWGVLNVSNS